VCGLELAVPLAAELIASSHTLVDAERRRRELIQRMWNEQLAAQAIETETQPAPADVPDAAGASAATVAAPPFPTFPAVPSAPSAVQTAPTAVPHAPSAAASASVAAASPVQPALEPVDSRPRRSGVQVFLLVTGIVLLSVFALFFVTVAYLFATVEVRVAVTALAGVVVFGIAWLLKRRHLPATAEGVGVTGAVILIGVLEFVRGAELFGSASIAPALYSGVGFLLLSALLEGLHRISRLRFARLGSVLLAPTGVALVVIGALGTLDSGLAWWAGLASAGASTIVLPQVRQRSAEASLVRWIALVCLTAALVPAALLLPEVPGSSALSYSVTAVVWGAVILRLRTGPHALIWIRAAAVLLGLSASLAPTVAIVRHASTEWNLWAPGTAAGIIAVAFVVGARASTEQLTSRTCRDAQIPALVVAALGLLPGLGLAALHVLSSVVPRYLLWQANPGDTAGFLSEMGAWAAVLAPGAAAALGAIGIRIARPPKAVGAIVGGLAALALLAAASHAGTVLLALVAFAVVAATGLAGLLVTRGQRAPAVRIPSVVLLGVAGFAVVVLSHASAPLWLPGALTVAALIVASRFAVAPETRAASVVRPLLTGLAVGFGFVETTLLMPWISGWRPSSSLMSSSFPSATDLVALPGAAAVLLLCVVPLVLRTHAGLAPRGTWDLRAAAIVALLTAFLSSLVLFATSSVSTVDHVARIAIPLGLAVAAIVWQVRGSVAHTAERMVLAGLAPLALAATLSAIADAATAASAATASSAALIVDLAAPVAAILAAALGAILFTRASSGPRRAARIAWESAIALVVFVSVVSCIAPAGESTWLVLLLLAVTPLIVGFADGNPFTNRSPRRFGGTLSCVLAAAALWQFLGFRGVADVEPYTLPLAGLLLGLTAAIALFSAQTATVEAVRSTLFAASLVIALVPSALVSIGDERPVRAVVILVTAAALMTAALLVPRVVRGVLVRDSALYSGIAVLAAVGLARAVRDALVSDTGLLFPEIWVLPAVIALVVTSVVWTRRRALPFRVAQFGVPAAVTLVAVSVVVCLIALPETTSSIRLTAANTTFVGVAVAAALRRRVPLDRVSQLAALCALVVVGATGLVTGAAHPFELSTTPVALALIVSGLITLRRDAAARTWPNLGLGIAVLLVPSLLADFGGTELWRVIALGVLSVALVVASIVVRWQAPLIVSGVVLLVHAVAQSWPWIQGLYSVVPWWIWLGIGGVILVAVAARYEHRVRNLRSFVGTISSLR